MPAPPIVINALREWKLVCPAGGLGLVFPNGLGKVESLANIINRGLIPTLARAGIEGRYTGMHALRHFYASWLINRPQNGGHGMPPKLVQEGLGTRRS